MDGTNNHPEAFQAIRGGKWHHVWWQPWMEHHGIVMTHISGSYQADMPRKPLAEVKDGERCKACLPLTGQSLRARGGDGG